MNIRYGKGKRKAISPVLATVILIAITLIAAIAIAGFVFGLFGSFTATAQISASAVSCNNTTGECQILLTNTGNAAAKPNACSFSGNVAGVGAMGTTKGPPPTVAPLSIAGGSSETIYCQDVGLAGAGSGIAVSGQVSLSNGGSILFSGTWQ